MNDEFGTLARIAERQRYAHRLYRAPVILSDPPTKREAKAQAPARIKTEKRPSVVYMFRKRAANKKDNDLKPDHRGRISDIVVTAAAAFGVTVEDMLSPSHIGKVARPRFAAMHLLVKVLRISLSSVATVFHRDHSTVKKAVRKAARLRRRDASFARRSRLLVVELRRKWRSQ